MKLSEMVYKRPDIEQVKADLTKFVEDLKNAKTFEEADAVFTAMDKYSDTLETMMTLCYIRHSINTKDKFYEEEQEGFDENTPVFMERILRYLKRTAQKARHGGACLPCRWHTSTPCARASGRDNCSRRCRSRRRRGTPAKPGCWKRSRRCRR